MEIAIITDDPGWHGARLKRALESRGHQSTYVSLTACQLDISGAALPVIIPGFQQHLPDGVFVRGIPGGSLEQVTFYLDILHALRHLGICVYNDARAIEKTVDKGMTSWLLHRAGIPTPATWVLGSTDEAFSIARREMDHGNMVVSKPLFGSQGVGLQRYQTHQDLASLSSANGIFYLQRYIPPPMDSPSHDWRVFVIRGKAVAAMKRSGNSWLNNVAQGATCSTASLADDTALGALAEDAVRTLGMAYAGVDIMSTGSGTLTVIEVNSVPAWKGLQGVSTCNVAELLVEDMLALIGNHQ